MWMLDNQTAYGAERNWIRERDGAHRWLVAVRATFDIGPGGVLKLADEQKPPVLAPEYFGEPGRSSLKCDSDLLGVKATTDILVHAHAHAPNGRLATHVVVRLRVGGLDKALVVHGDRRYRTAREKGVLGVTSSAPFESRPIHYEWAFGGSDTESPDTQKHRHDSRNPLGKGVAVDAARLEGRPAHCIEYPQGDPAKVGPAGFGPIDSFWSPRLERAGTYDAKWERARRPLLPEDYDERFVQCAPADQLPERPLRGGERVELTNLTPEGLVRLELPKLDFVFTTRVAGRREVHGATLATVLLEPEEKRLAMVWQTSLPVTRGDADRLELTRIEERASTA